MLHETELMREILTSPKGQTILTYVSPVYDRAFLGLWLFEIIGRELDTLSAWTEDVEGQLLPQTATWAIPYYEQGYGIPSDETISLEERRKKLLAKIRTRAPMNPHKLQTVVMLATGEMGEIDENIADNTFRVYLPAVAQKKEKLLRKGLDEAKPAHLVYEIRYTQDIRGRISVGGYHRTAVELTIHPAVTDSI